MASVSIICGILLILVGLGGYAYGMMEGRASLTALIPAVLGLILALLGFVANAKENLRKHIMHGAVLVGLVGFLATVSSVFKLPSLFDGTAERPAAIVAQFLTALISFVFVVLCVKSFVDARRSGTV